MKFIPQIDPKTGRPKTKVKYIGNIYTKLKKVVCLVEDEGMVEVKRYKQSVEKLTEG